MAEKSRSAATQDDRVIVSSRVFDAPRMRVYEAFRDPEQLACWWGPKDFTNSLHEFDFRPGGLWRFTMHGPDGVDFLNESVFEEIVEPGRIVFRHREPIHGFQMAMTFSEQGDQTTLTWRMCFDSAEECDRVRALVVEANEQNFDRLADHLTKRETAAMPLVITRVFDAPRSLVFDAWTKQEHLARWSAPRGFSIPCGEGDVRPGGVWRCCMKSPDDKDLWLGGVYREVVPGERLVFTHAWDDATGQPGHETLVTVSFADHPGGGTTLTFRQEGFPSIASRDGHAEGWNECFDRLVDHLAAAQFQAASR
ncbi:MAG: SRPBCC family protein [Planctomycetaceae bacterium]